MTKVRQEKSFAVHWILLNVNWENFALSILKVLKKAIAHKIHRENLQISSKIHENRKTFQYLLFTIIYTQVTNCNNYKNMCINLTVNKFVIKSLQI